jgi:F0F1-type ATP synthase membrane subunit b/b'
MNESIIFAVVGVVIGAVIALVIAKTKNTKSDAAAATQGADLLAKAKNEAEVLRKNARDEAKQIIREERQQLENELERKKKGIADLERGLTKK